MLIPPSPISLAVYFSGSVTSSVSLSLLFASLSARLWSITLSACLPCRKSGRNHIACEVTSRWGNDADKKSAIGLNSPHEACSQANNLREINTNTLQSRGHVRKKNNSQEHVRRLPVSFASHPFSCLPLPLRTGVVSSLVL